MNTLEPGADRPHLALFDYGAGNLHSLKKGLERGGARVTVTTDWDAALDLDGLVLPGVGSFGAAVQGIGGQEDRIREVLEGGHPCLGICLGMQLLLPESEEAEGRGIGLLPGRVRRLRAPVVPQMGWNDVEVGNDPVLAGVADGGGTVAAYYANSYVCQVDDPALVIARSEYHREVLAAGVRKARTWGFQFHPEKSSAPGLRLLANFVEEVARRSDR
jgi:imidazole glycerol-phosphate synthase subunit HisH